MATLLLLAAGLQTAQAQVMKIWHDGRFDSYDVSIVDSVTYVETAYEWVDLGLPSGTLWATCNIGANSPEEFGDFFAWGETETKQKYTMDNYKFYKDGGWTKYCPFSFGDGFSDNLSKLLPEDDAATANWGSEWQTPDVDQWWELIKAGYTTLEWTESNGVKGMQVKGNSNGQSIFFPISYEDYEFGSYWSSTIDDLENDLAFRFYFYKDELIYTDDRDYRYNGHQVRPVRVEKGAPILVESIELSATSLVLAPGETVQLTATVLPADARQPAVLWHSSDCNVVDLNQSGKLTAVGIGTCTITCSATDGSGVTAECRVRVWKADTKEYVDLGLPSGTLWATCNIGAKTPEEYGDYFAWGETEPKEDYSWSTYKHCNGSYGTMTRYCQESKYGYNGFTDDLTELLAEDDAATVNWGSEWQMPSLDQIEELYNKEYTTEEWTTQNGVDGCKVTGKNGNSIFLPAAGYRNDKSFGQVGFGGHYWSHSLWGIDTFGSGAYYLSFTQRADLEERSNRLFIGCSVRPVRVENTVHVQEIALNKEAVTLSTYGEPATLSQTVQLVATVLPENADNKAVKWESSDTSIAVVSEDGVVTATLRGTNPLRDSCTITCSALDGSGVKATCVVTVDNSAIVL